METILVPILMLCLLAGGGALFFLLFVQPIWSLIDIAVSRQHEGGAKATLIVLALLLGPLMTFFYGCVGTPSRGLKRSTWFFSGAFVLAAGSLLALAIAVPMAQQHLPWWPAASRNAPPPTAPGADDANVQARITEDAETNTVAPESVPPFTAVHLARNGGRWNASIAECDGHGPKPKSAAPITLPSIYPLTHVAVDPRGPDYYGITTHEVARIIPDAGEFVELRPAHDGTKPSWPAALAFDANRERLLIAARSQGYAYHPKSGEWHPLPWLADDGIVALAYDPASEALYALKSEAPATHATRLLQFNAQGALLSSTPLSRPIPVGRYPFALAQLAAAQAKLICTVSPSEKELDASQPPVARLYLIEPRTGLCQPVRSNQAKTSGSPAIPTATDAAP